METPAEMKPGADVRDQLADDRTLLVWIRAGIALMAFGFVVARFDLFLQRLKIIEQAPPAEAVGISPWFGVALIAAGIVAIVFSARNHVRLALEAEAPARSRLWIQSVTIAVSIALLGLAMTIYLVRFGIGL